ncbi:LacI family transcriptional regulator [Enterococcus casseliflavus]|uniref:LacI family DNA-binding transcriptional regulator n=1 Tax=Enterococcus TaxID=1350 RepID=UPI000E507413|nr:MULTISPECIES: LacI family DNA-binding transcriptional regulator [Enterococcus]MBO6359540.1 LacI family transcriptional regulator [Enterococcus casseliflavus]MBO6377905.1 LacI family transcriptional regulator [Enterococcus casseliflavus]RHH52988.1 LacI family transcriptional regulator [Enterococcus casseliflavus]
MVIKLTDVAQLAGVSPTTVSRVINNYGSLSQKTIDKVHAAMKELNYQPNSLARSLQGKNTRLVGLIFPTVANPFYGELVEKIERKLFEMDYRTILCDSAHNKEKERSYLNMLAANKVDGIIAGAHNLGIEEYEDLELPIVSFDRYLADGIPIVGSDNFQGGFLATENLFLRGARKIAIMTGSQESDSPTNERLNGYLAFLEKQGLPSQIFPFHSTAQSTTLKKLEIKRILENEDIDGIFCTDDLTAILVANQCHKSNISVPDQLKIIGYDGTKLIQNYFPQLTTMAQPISDYADVLIDLLLQRVQEPEKPLESHYHLPVKLIQGETT